MPEVNGVCDKPSCPLLKGARPSTENFEIRRQHRKQMITIGAIAVVLMAGILALGWLANAGREASLDSSNSTGAQFAVQVRGACTSERRDARDSAIGRMNQAGLLAQKALKDKDTAEYNHQIDIGIEASKDFDKWVGLLKPDKLNLPVNRGGCGPPITNRGQIKGN